MRHIRLVALIICTALIFSMFSGCTKETAKDIKNVKVLVIPKFEIDEMSGDFPGEAQLVYEKYLNGVEETKIDTLPECSHFYFNEENGVALLITGAGKTACGIATSNILANENYNFDDTFILSIGCAGGSVGYCTLGDVVLNTATCDFDLGHAADSRDMEDPNAKYTWFYDASYDNISNVKYNKELVSQVYDLVKDIELQTTDISKEVLAANYGDAEWANRAPMVIKGTSITSDNYWKGQSGHDNACKIAETYGCEDPYADTEMEENAIANAVRAYEHFDHHISLRVVVNMDVFLKGESPESVWGAEEAYNEKITEENSETLDIFEPGMHNLFDVSDVLISAVLDGSLVLE